MSTAPTPPTFFMANPSFGPSMFPWGVLFPYRGK